MNLKGKTIVIGDIHGDFGGPSGLNSFITKKQPKLILACGDFGYWPRWKEKSKNAKYPKERKIVKAGDTEIRFCDGNHEDHWSLRNLKDNEVYPNVFYQKRGSVYTLEDGRNVLFMGGAQSIDKIYRTEGLDWFREEEISYADMENLPDPNTKIDIVISHTCPESIESQLFNGYNLSVDDWSRKALEHIRQIYKPDLWYFGHFHGFKEFYALGCKWTCLNMSRENNW